MNVIIDERKENAMTFNKVLLSWIVILIITTSIYLFWQLGDINDVFNQSILINVR
ncbi:iron ABC transporter permease, partial [Acinetobacter baumannii]|nr:iron ABC transporter permease [Acinetobacter baumannii]MCP8622610.1 iron ABC transporter permease [Acinetobacter baumannii]